MSRGNKFFAAGAGLALAFWGIDPWVDAVFFREGDFFGQLLRPESTEIYFRSLVSALVLGFAFWGKRLLAESEKREAALRESEERLRKIKEGLKKTAEELSWKNLALTKAKEQAEEATRLKDKFVGMVVHDLRAPLASAVGFLELALGDPHLPPLPEEQREILKTASSNVRALMEIIDGLLELDRLQSGTIKPNPFFLDAKSIGNETLELLGHLAGEKGIEMVNDIPPGIRLFADYNLFFAMLRNLVSNAIKFSRKGDRVTLFVPPGEKSSVAVKDTGIGIRKERIPDLFDGAKRFTTEGTDGEKGNGLGLAFVHEIVRAHGGSLGVESEEGKGSVFYVQLPRPGEEINNKRREP